MSKVVASEFRLPDDSLVFDQTNILGAVSEAAGVPTGRIIEQGSNANGEYVRFADGTQVVWGSFSMGSITSAGSGTLADPYRTSVSDWTYPVSFVGASPFLAHHARIGFTAARGASYIARNGALGLVSVQGLQAYRTSSASNADEVTAWMMAIGRWF
jgi:hypothetical protein